MRYRLMASYLGASYQAAVGPSDRDVTLFAAPPPPEEHGFSPAPGGIWRKQVRLDDLDALWESRPIGSYHGEPCLVLDDLGDRLHIVYLGMEERRAAQLGYWEVDRGVFEVVVPRYDVTDLAEERHEFPIALLLSALPRALSAGGPGGPGTGQNGAGAVPAGTGRAIGAIGSGSAAGPSGTAAAAGAGGLGTAGAAGGFGAGQGPNGMAAWNGPAGAPQRVRGQLPAGDPAQFAPAMSQPPAAASAQPPITGVYQAPTGNTQNGAGLPGAPSMPPGGPQMAGGPPGTGIAQGAGLPRVPVGQLAIAAPGQGAQGTQGMTGTQGMAGGPGMAGTQGQPPAAQPTAGTAPLPDPSRQFPVRPQLPVAQLPAAQQPMGQQQPVGQQQSMGQQSMGQQPMSQQPAAQQSVGQQPMAQQSTTQQPAAQQFPFPAAPQGAGDPQATGAATVGAAPPLSGQAPAPTAVAAWHGSPAAEGNGTWYYQPADPQQGGAVAGGYAGGGLTPNGYAQQEPNRYAQYAQQEPNGYAQQDQGSAQAGSANLNGLGGMQQYAQPGSQAPVTGYQQVPALPPAVPGQQAQQLQQAQSFQQPQNAQSAQAVQPMQAVQPTQAQQWAQAVQPAQAPQPAQAQPGPQFVAPQAPPTTAPANGAEPMMPGSAAGGTGRQTADLPTVQAPVGASAAMSAPVSALLTAPAASPSTAPQPMAPQPVAPPSPGPQSAGLQPTAPPLPPPAPAAAPAPPEASATGPLPSLPPAIQPDQAAHAGLTGAGALGKLSGAVRGRRAARKPRLAMSSIFADLVDMADIPRSAYSVDEEITGAMCLFKTDGGYEVFSCAEDARHEVRFFEEEEAAYFYLFGVLAAEALRNGRLSPRRG